jgi:hypothetical protein
MAFTKEEENIIEAIWGDTDPDVDPGEIETVVTGIVSMAEIMAKKWDEGLTVAFEAPTNLH